MKKNSLIKIIFSLSIFLIVSGLVITFTSVQILGSACPPSTTPATTSAVLVGEITDDGGDPNLTVWFRYGTTNPPQTNTPSSSQNGTGIFCITVSNLTPCTQYYYQAVAQNSAGTSYGEIKTFTTHCLPVSVDLKANNSNGPITVSYQSNVTFSWTSTNASTCTASGGYGGWSGTKSTSGSQVIQMNQVGNFTFTLTCTDSSGTITGTDSVTVNVTAVPPVVITKPAIVTN